MKNPRWIYANFNVWNKFIGDCPIRAVSAATGLKYQEVCKRFGYSWKNGHGLIRDTGATIEEIKSKFNEYFDIVEDFYDDYDFVPDEFKGTDAEQELIDFDNQHNIGPSAGITLNEFVDMFKNQGTFVVSLTGNPNAKNKSCREGGHVVCVKCNRGHKQGFIDFWDSGEMLVDAYMRIKKKEPADSPLHWKYDYENHRLIP